MVVDIVVSVKQRCSHVRWQHSPAHTHTNCMICRFSLPLHFFAIHNNEIIIFNKYYIDRTRKSGWAAHQTSVPVSESSSFTNITIIIMMVLQANAEKKDIHTLIIYKAVAREEKKHNVANTPPFADALLDGIETRKKESWTKKESFVQARY